MDTPLEIYTTLICSLSHITLDDYTLISEAADSRKLIADNLPYGLRLFLLPGELELFNEQARDLGLSPWALALCARAAALGCRWLELDRDGQSIQDLPLFNW